MTNRSEGRFIIFACIAILILAVAGYYRAALFLAILVLIVLGVLDFRQKV